ncbi:MAG: DNA polymerase III subunit alpha, partial [Elusimicrobiaceae bacterium]|nr:DNA polymerase III subunit alpha [Elusimicrobiaceae bacterium]
MDFVHLHNHSEFSLLDGMLKINSGRGKPSEFLKTIAGQGVRAMAVTDHGNMFGAVDFYFAAREVGIHPIIGCEMYEASGSRLDKKADSVNSHLTVLARNETGYRNMLAMLSEAYLNGFYNRPRIDKELLAQHGEGLVVLSGCMQSQLSQACLKGNLDEAVRLAAQYRDIVGDGNFYLEIMDHGIAEEKTILEGILEVARRTGLPLVATNDCHYHHKADWQAHDVHLCIATGSALDDPDRFKMTTHELYFKSADEMKQLFSFCPEAIRNTVEIANKCQFKLEYGKSILPVFPLPPDAGTDNIELYLRGLCLKGLKLKLGTETIAPDYMQRLEFELGVINKMQFPSYFLIVSDFIAAARGMGVPVGPGRGSGAGSLVSYSLDITRVDPL